MTRHIAFLRAINVGGRVVTMDRLRSIFVELGFRGVETFIASGNVVFESRTVGLAALEARIERALADSLGYEVTTFVRTPAELAAIASYAPFESSEQARAHALNVGFVRSELDRAAGTALDGLRTPDDRFHVRGREVYWLRMRRESASKISNGSIERALNMRATFRVMNTVVRLHTKLGAPAGREALRTAARAR